MATQLSPRDFANSLSEDEVVELQKQQPIQDEHGRYISGCPWPPESPLIFIKYGDTSLSLGDSEARTQQWAYESLNRLPEEARQGIRVPEIYRVIQHTGWTYVLMEYVAGKSVRQICKEHPDGLHVREEHRTKIGTAYRLLLSLPTPWDAAPGPVGGGLIRHPLFRDCRAPIVYESLDKLEQHLNQVATMVTSKAPTVTLERELHLVLGDLDEGNFMFTNVGMYIVDFKQASFLPLSFTSFALAQRFPLARSVENCVDKEQTPQQNMDAMRLICHYFATGAWTVDLAL